MEGKKRDTWDLGKHLQLNIMEDTQVESERLSRSVQQGKQHPRFNAWELNLDCSTWDQLDSKGLINSGRQMPWHLDHVDGLDLTSQVPHHSRPTVEDLTIKRGYTDQDSDGGDKLMVEQTERSESNSNSGMKIQMDLEEGKIVKVGMKQDIGQIINWVAV